MPRQVSFISKDNLVMENINIFGVLFYFIHFLLYIFNNNTEIFMKNLLQVFRTVMLALNKHIPEC